MKLYVKERVGTIQELTSGHRVPQETQEQPTCMEDNEPGPSCGLDE